MALVSFFMCAKTDEEARRADGATFFQFALRYYGASQNGSARRPAPSTCGTSTTREARDPEAGGGIARRPDRVTDHPQEIAPSALPYIDQVILLNQAGKHYPRTYLRLARTVREGSDAGIPERSRT
jgi:hypothetical protein